MRVLLFVALVACGRGGGGSGKDPDCVLVETDLTTAPAKLKAKYPGAPVKVFEIIEHCLAPDGDTCERMAKIWAALPSMMPGAGVDDAPPLPIRKALELCKGMPEDTRRCMLPSYAGGHADVCRKVIDDLGATELDVKPGSDALEHAPTITVTETEVLVDGTAVAKADGSSIGEPVRAALAARPHDPAAQKGLAIVHTDQNASAKTINEIVNAAKAAGYDNLLFDVKKP